MYLEFFGLAEKPFTITPNPRFIFLSKNHKEVFAHLLYGIRNHSGFIEVTGEVGAGKTTVLRTLFEQLEGDDYRLAFIFNPSLSAEELLRAICRELHAEVPGTSSGELLDALNNYLLRENHAGRTVVLVIDEAQNLTPSVLEQVRLLSNLETQGDKLIQIVLVGQPELGDLLDRPDLRQLNQRITVRYHLRPIDLEDTRAYIRHRLELAGVRDRELFSAAAVRRIFRYSGGLPRLINILCDRALLVAYSEDQRLVTPTEVNRAITELRRQRPHRRRWPLLVGGTLLALAIGMALFKPTAVVERDDAPASDTAGSVKQVIPARPVPPAQGEPDSAGLSSFRPPPDAASAADSRTVGPPEPALQGKESPLVLGFVPATTGPLASSDQAGLLAGYLREKLGKPVTVEIFSNEKELYDRIYRYRQVDLAVFHGAIPRNANHLPLPQLVGWQGQGGPAAGSGVLVARRGFGESLFEVLRRTLLGMMKDGRGQMVLGEAGGLDFLAARSPGAAKPDGSRSTPAAAGGGKQ
jgi:general secretion pathway protein A